MEAKIFMCCHKSFDMIPPLCVPVQGGAALNPPLSGTISDVGKNGSISEKNPNYCELTVQYYAWKNEEADYYGFCHYRRFFCFDEKVKKAYLAKKTLSEKEKIRFFKSESELKEIIGKYDVIVPRAEDMGISVKEYYALAKHHHREDIELFLDILNEKLPEYSEAAEKYMSQTRQYFCNMFIMKRELFFDYCEKLFALLEEFDRRKRPHGDFRSDRVDGYLGERFLGIYLTQMNGGKMLETARTDTGCTLKKRIGCAVFPPESGRRAAFKKLNGGNR